MLFPSEVWSQLQDIHRLVRRLSPKNKTRRDPGNGARVNMQWASAVCVMMFVSM